MTTSQSLVQFKSEYFEENGFKEEDLIELLPFGLALTPDPERPTLILKSSDGSRTLPVPLTPVEASLAMIQSNTQLPPSNSHQFLEKLMESLNIKIERAVFVEIKGQHQYLRVYLEGHPHYGSFKLKASENLSMLLQLKVRLFAPPEIMDKSRLLEAEIKGLQSIGLAGPLGTQQKYIQ